MKKVSFLLILAAVLSAAPCMAVESKVQAEPSIQAPAPEPPASMSPQQLQMLTEMSAQRALAAERLQIMALEVQIAEQQAKLQEIVNGPAEKIAAEMMKRQQEETEDSKENKMLSRVFPMPGGNPQVVSILGGNKKALEATLVFPNGLRYEVHKGMVLEGGYRVASVSSNGVVLEKNGFKLPMPLSSGSVEDKSDKPWDRGQEMGIPSNNYTPPPPLPVNPPIQTPPPLPGK